MNTTLNMQSDIYDARKALGGYLERTDLLLARSGLSRSERDETLGQIAEQFYDLLGVPVGEADKELAEDAIARLAPEHTFELRETATTGHQIRATWYRLMIGRPVPLFLNDHGTKRVVWGEIIQRLLWLGLLMVILFTISGMIVLGRNPWGWGFVFLVVLMQQGIWGGLVWKYHHTPVESLPRIDDWPATLQQQNQYVWMLYASGSFFFILALFPMAYWLIATILNRPTWPVDQGLFTLVSVALITPSYAFFLWDARQRRRNTRRFNNWDRWVAPDSDPVDQGQLR